MEGSRRIAVVGATGRVGRHAVDVLQERGHEVVPISRSLGVDVITGEGLTDALTGVDVVIDAASGPSPEQEAATSFFTTASRNLQEIGAHAGVGEMVVVSIIGTDRLAAGYFAAKAVQEEAMASGPVPVRVLRAAQFHEFVDQLVQWGTQDEVSHLPFMRTQLVAARTVAEALADLATGRTTATEPFSEIAGPREERLADAATLLVARQGRTLKIEEVSNPDDPATEIYENGGLLPGPDAIGAGPTFEEWLDSTP